MRPSLPFLHPRNCNTVIGLAATAGLFCIKYKFHASHSLLYMVAPPKESNPEMQYLSTVMTWFCETDNIHVFPFERTPCLRTYTNRRPRDATVQKAFMLLARDKKQQQELHSLLFHRRARPLALSDPRQSQISRIFKSSKNGQKYRTLSMPYHFSCFLIVCMIWARIEGQTNHNTQLQLKLFGLTISHNLSTTHT